MNSAECTVKRHSKVLGTELWVLISCVVYRWDVSVSLFHNWLTYPMEQSPSWETNTSLASPEILRILWKPQGSLQHSQDPSTFPYPERDRSSPCSNLISRKSALILSSSYAWIFQEVSFPQDSPSKPCMHACCSLYVLQTLPISVFLSSSPEWCLVSLINYLDNCALFSFWSMSA